MDLAQLKYKIEVDTRNKKEKQETSSSDKDCWTCSGFKCTRLNY